MYIRRVVVEDVRGFSKVDFEFDEPDGSRGSWSVITGDNSSGKTSILKAIAVALVGPSTARVLQDDFSSWIRNGETVGRVAVQMVAGPDDKFASGKRFEKAFWCEVEFEKDERGLVNLKPGTALVGGKKGGSRGPWLEHPLGWFCVGYGPFRRLYGHSPEAQRLMSTSGKVSRFATLFREDATLFEADGWLRELHLRRLEKNQEATLILKKVLAVLNSDVLRNGVKVLDVNSSGVMLQNPNCGDLLLKDMSDGYRSTLALVVDILRHIVDVHGDSEIALYEDGTVKVNAAGLVIVDEIDAHLHPEWQRTIGEVLKSLFPKLQFLVATHSAFVCQASSHQGIYHLPVDRRQEPYRLSEVDYQEVIASKPNHILTGPAFGLGQLRSDRAVSARRRFAELSAKQASLGLTRAEQTEKGQLSLFATTDNYEATA